MENRWNSDPAFQILQDIIASDHLVVITGAGISRGLPTQEVPFKTLPGWIDLLRDLAAKFKADLTDENRADCIELLSGDSIRSQCLIEAASILRKAKDKPEDFDKAFRAMVTSEPGEYSVVHEVLLQLQPRGIVTFNYDSAHESSIGGLFKYELLTPTDEAKFIALLQKQCADFFLLKAHGSTAQETNLVLTAEDYRDLLAKSPSYRAFLQYLFANFSFLIVGFGMDDPDFDELLLTVMQQFGSPVHRHVLLKHEKDKNTFDIVLRRWYGIHSLYITEWEDIPLVLQAASQSAGPELRHTIAMCLNPDLVTLRGQGHKRLIRLGKAGQSVADNELRTRLNKALKDSDHLQVSEIAYSLGFFGAERHKQLLMDLVDSAVHVDVPAKALTVLRPVLRLEDLDQLKLWKEKFTRTALQGKNVDRVLAYINYLLTYIPSKFSSNQESPASS